MEGELHDTKRRLLDLKPPDQPDAVIAVRVVDKKGMKVTWRPPKEFVENENAITGFAVVLEKVREKGDAEANRPEKPKKHAPEKEWQKYWEDRRRRAPQVLPGRWQRDPFATTALLHGLPAGTFKVGVRAINSYAVSDVRWSEPTITVPRAEEDDTEDKKERRYHWDSKVIRYAHYMPAVPALKYPYGVVLAQGGSAQLHARDLARLTSLHCFHTDSDKGGMESDFLLYYALLQGQLSLCFDPGKKAEVLGLSIEKPQADSADIFHCSGCDWTNDGFAPYCVGCGRLNLNPKKYEPPHSKGHGLPPPCGSAKLLHDRLWGDSLRDRAWDVELLLRRVVNERPFCAKTHASSLAVLRGNHLSNTSCLTRVFNTGE